MIPYMNLNEQVDADFTRARRRARLRAVMARIRREHTSNRLLSFDDVRRELVANNRLHRGTRVVEVDEIIGSVGVGRGGGGGGGCDGGGGGGKGGRWAKQGRVSPHRAVLAHPSCKGFEA